MKDPSLSNVSAPNMTISNEVILSSQFGSEDDPFAEYMWMENEEEFNRQVRPGADGTPDVQVKGRVKSASTKHRNPSWLFREGNLP